MKTKNAKGGVSRRQFVQRAAVGAGVLGFPMIVPSRVLGADAPSGRIRVAQIGCGRIAHDMDMPGVLGTDAADYVAVCDYDSKRAAHAKKFIEDALAKKNRPAGDIKVYGDFREVIARPDIDAVVISTPDHQHAEPAAAAALAGKDIWLQKPLAMAVAESRACCDTVMKSKRILQIGSQQRSSENFRKACEYVRSGRVGHLTHIEIGLPKDETKADDPEQPVPANFNYEGWLGCTPMAYYTEQRVHSQKEISSIRPGWLRNEDHCLGMITGWGSHHYDIAHWGMGIVEGGPEKVEGEAEFPTNKIWNVHLAYHIQLRYPGNIVVNVSDTYPNGVKFIGDEGWIFVSRGPQKATASDPTAGQQALKALDASDPKLISGKPSVELYVSTNHHKNWTDCLKSRKEPITPVNNGHHVFAACAVSWVAMKLKRPLTWDAKAEKFVGDEEANKMLRRVERPGYGIFNLLARQKA
jgi:myo-inositol 2-dehydrogenase / D-chiro-inositol 1-dehydrogenase